LTVSASGATSATPTDAGGGYSYFQFNATGSLTVA
jgi:hypothetical protein